MRYKLPIYFYHYAFTVESVTISCPVMRSVKLFWMRGDSPRLLKKNKYLIAFWIPERNFVIPINHRLTQPNVREGQLDHLTVQQCNFIKSFSKKKYGIEFQYLLTFLGCQWQLLFHSLKRKWPRNYQPIWLLQQLQLFDQNLQRLHHHGTETQQGLKLLHHLYHIPISNWVN